MPGNRLIHQTSPYLLQHAHNPVDWYPWGREAFERAVREDKPIFLSVGYSTCYWCHVMERQSFENEQIAALMNQKFINIKVDREERPDVDQVYMTAVQILTRQGGWPMSVFLTPDLKPFFGGTYFPPDDRYGRPGFPRLLEGVENAYRTRRQEVQASADEIVRLIARVSEPRAPQEPIDMDHAWLGGLIERSTTDFDSQHGGFGGAPKFPRQTLLELLLAASQTPQVCAGSAIRNMVLRTLDAMAAGGIRDHLGGGFHRYSTDAIWLVPHFEIMLYDNAMLAICYTEAWQQTGHDRYARVARGILDFVLREMTSPQGGFYTAFDAEVDAMEGASYLWTEQEVRSELEVDGSFTPDEVELFLRVYGLDQGPNFADPHHGSGQPDKNILFLPEPMEQVAAAMGYSEEMLETRLEPMREALYAIRQQRKQPLLDTKILTSWNALMIRALAAAGAAFKEPRYLDAAGKAADFLFSQHRLGDGTLLRTSRADATPPPSSVDVGTASSIVGFLDDYAFLAQALLALFEATKDHARRQQAVRTVETLKQKFLDPQSGGFFFTASDVADLIVRQKVASDSPLPSGNAVAAMCLLAIGDVEQAQRALAVFAQTMKDQAEGCSALLQALLDYLTRVNEPIAAGKVSPSASPSPTLAEQARSVVQLQAQWGSPTELKVIVAVQPPYHLNAHDAAEGLVPTRLTISGTEKEYAVEYPPGERRRYAWADQALPIYEGTIVMLARFEAPLPPGTPLELSLSFQPCSEDACLSPAKVRTSTASP